MTPRHSLSRFLSLSLVSVGVALAAGTTGCKKTEDDRGPAPAATAVETAETTAPATRRRPDTVGPTTAIGQGPLLERFDANGDGKLDDSEVAVMEKARLAAVIKRLDSNGDGLVSRSEAQAGGPRLERLLSRWDELDGDGSGALDTEELAAALKTRRRARERLKPGPVAPAPTATEK